MINVVLSKIEDEKTLRRIYRFIERMLLER
jgi:hypothetical protein